MRSNVVVLSAPVTSDADSMDNVLTFPGIRLRSTSERSQTGETLLKVALDETRRTGTWETFCYVIIGSAAIGVVAISLIGPW